MSAVIVKNLGKRFRRIRPDRVRSLKDAFFRGWRFPRTAEYFWALREVSFEVAAGKMMGIIGHNGAGKSTLLRLVGGIGRPDSGAVTVNGRLVGQLELGAGFHPDLSGRENVFINGVIAGLTRREVARKFDSIVAFSELKTFIDNPLHTYSNGMRLRLGFAVAVHTDPRILLIDELLAVGDRQFRVKCLSKIVQFKAQGCAILLVSHDLNTVSQVCDEVIWLHKGRVVAHGPVDIVTQKYRAKSKATSLVDQREPT